jgi:predicted molibdopterin-dependent oxidoreductase YjgC
VRVCDEVEGVGAIDFIHRGFRTKISPPYEKDLDCEFCGQCVAVCPTGALTGKMWGQKGRQNLKEIDTVCSYCGCGCNLTLHVRRNEIIRVSSKPETINEGWLCAKGRFAHGFVHSPERLTKPLIRIAPKKQSTVVTPSLILPPRGGGQGWGGDPTNYSSLFREASWEEALDYVAERLKEVKRKYGPDSIGGLASARCTNEENYLFQKCMRAGIGTNNVDHCARY